MYLQVFVADGHLGCFHFGAIMINAAVKVHEEVFVWTYVFSSLGFMVL